MTKEQDGQVIQYIDGFAWGVGPTGRTVCLGDEAKIKELLTMPKQKRAGNPTIDQIISLERSLVKQKEKEDVKEKTKVLKKRKARIAQFHA